jgi:type II secretory pathway pseudopilin PulG
MRKGKQKFTLIEVLVAMGVFMVGIAPLLGVLASTTRVYQGQVNKSNVASFVREKMSDFRDGVGVVSSANIEADKPYDMIRYSVDIQSKISCNIIQLSVEDKNSSSSAPSHDFTYIEVVD